MDGGGRNFMNKTIVPGPRTGTAAVPASKSQAHRLLIAAALSEKPCTMTCHGASRDIYATVACLNALGADIREERPGEFAIYPISAAPEGERRLPCGESGSTLRFLLPVAGALGVQADFVMEGRLPERLGPSRAGGFYDSGKRFEPVYFRPSHGAAAAWRHEPRAH